MAWCHCRSASLHSCSAPHQHEAATTHLGMHQGSRVFLYFLLFHFIPVLCHLSGLAGLSASELPAAPSLTRDIRHPRTSGNPSLNHQPLPSPGCRGNLQAPVCVAPSGSGAQWPPSNTEESEITGLGTSLVAQWLRLCASTAGGHGFDLWSGN